MTTVEVFALAVGIAVCGFTIAGALHAAETAVIAHRATKQRAARLAETRAKIAGIAAPIREFNARSQEAQANAARVLAEGEAMLAGWRADQDAWRRAFGMDAGKRHVPAAPVMPTGRLPRLEA